MKLKNIEKRAKEKNLEFNLTEEWLKEKLERGRCEATGIKFDTTKAPFMNPFYPTIDRVDSSKGYTIDNCQLVCHMYNIAKSEFPEEVFTQWAKAYVETYEKRVLK